MNPTTVTILLALIFLVFFIILGHKLYLLVTCQIGEPVKERPEERTIGHIIEVDGKEYQVVYANSLASAMSDIVAWVKNLESDATFPIFAGEKIEDTIRNKTMDPFIKESHKAFRDYQKSIERR